MRNVFSRSMIWICCAFLLVGIVLTLVRVYRIEVVTPIDFGPHLVAEHGHGLISFVFSIHGNEDIELTTDNQEKAQDMVDGLYYWLNSPKNPENRILGLINIRTVERIRIIQKDLVQEWVKRTEPTWFRTELRWVRVDE